LLSDLLKAGYDARLEVDDFLMLEFIGSCWICGEILYPEDPYIAVLRYQAQAVVERFGSLLHMGQHVLLVDLIE